MKPLLNRSEVAICSNGGRAVECPSPGAQKAFDFVTALRPFSLVVALVSCGLGIKLASPQGGTEVAIAVAVMISGLLLQCGVNLINDRADMYYLTADADKTNASRRQILRNFYAGLLCFALAAAIGVGIARQTGPAVMVVGLVGLLGAYTYTQEPFNYKRRGLGVVFVFVLMGVLMVQGAYLAVTGEFSLNVLTHSLPISCLVALLLLSNELRDYEKDAAQGIRTLTVRISLANAVRLYWSLVLAAYLITGLLIVSGDLKPSLWLMLPLPLLPLLARHLRAAERRPLTPDTGQFLLLFGVGYALAL